MLCVGARGPATVSNVYSQSSAGLPTAEHPISAIDGTGTSVWVLYDQSLHRYTHDPLAAFA